MLRRHTSPQQECKVHPAWPREDQRSTYPTAKANKTREFQNKSKIDMHTKDILLQIFQ